MEISILLEHEDSSRQVLKSSLIARDRISLILDDESPFLELMPFAGYGVKLSSPCASLVVGIGLVQYVQGSP